MLTVAASTLQPPDPQIGSQPWQVAAGSSIVPMPMPPGRGCTESATAALYRVREGRTGGIADIHERQPGHALGSRGIHPWHPNACMHAMHADESQRSAHYIHSRPLLQTPLSTTGTLLPCSSIPLPYQFACVSVGEACHSYCIPGTFTGTVCTGTAAEAFLRPHIMKPPDKACPIRQARYSLPERLPALFPCSCPFEALLAAGVLQLQHLDRLLQPT